MASSLARYVAQLVADTLTGKVSWKPTNHGFEHEREPQRYLLVRDDKHYELVQYVRGSVVDSERQKDGWLGPCKLHALWDAVNTKATAAPAAPKRFVPTGPRETRRLLVNPEWTLAQIAERIESLGFTRGEPTAPAQACWNGDNVQVRYIGDPAISFHGLEVDAPAGRAQLHVNDLVNLAYLSTVGPNVSQRGAEWLGEKQPAPPAAPVSSKDDHADRDDTTPCEAGDISFWLRGPQVGPGLYGLGTEADGRVTSITTEGEYLHVHIGDAVVVVKLPRGVNMPFAVDDRVSVRQRDASRGIHPAHDIVIRDASGELLVAIAASGDGALAPGWNVSTLIDPKTGAAAVRLEHGGRVAILRGRPRRLTIGEASWIVVGAAHAISPPGRPLVPDERASHSFAIVRARS